ncbi:hypothetical protein KC19_VG066400 [Ceratodon purpureus]|uniref:Uncharacterized protein n=1 Tax=Ceratodon purpureus TaxID=3225 RepID=A0A8T0HMG8_CERPU|nr:hypothetical protein KC19_VG066400 [Ceratodon purpureus]
MPCVQGSHILGVQSVPPMVHVPWSVLPRVSWECKHVTTSCFCLHSGSVYWICLVFVDRCIVGGRRPGLFSMTRWRRHVKQLLCLLRQPHSD